MSLAGDSVVYVLVLLAVLAVVAGVMYAIPHLWKPSQDQTRAGGTHAGQDTHRTA